VLAAEPEVAWDVQTPDLAWVRREIARFLKPFALSAHANQPYHARLVHRRLQRAELTLIDYGGEVAIDAGRITGCYLLQVPLSGSYMARCGGDPVQVKTHWAHVVHPGTPLDMEWTRDCRVLVLRFGEAMMAECRTGHPLCSEPFSLDAEPHRSLGRVIDYVAREATAGRLFHNAPHIAAYAENLLLATLTSTLDHGGSAVQHETVPAYVRRAERYLLEHMTEDVTVAEIAQAIDSPTRTLHDGFKRANGVGPLTWLRAERLERARRELLNGRRGELHVTDVATRWGFQHLGRFCVAYRERFGETPTQTLRRERRGASRSDAGRLRDTAPGRD
jgi:AraC-like DNA-binding protein